MLWSEYISIIPKHYWTQCSCVNFIEKRRKQHKNMQHIKKFDIYYGFLDGCSIQDNDHLIINRNRLQLMNHSSNAYAPFANISVSSISVWSKELPVDTTPVLQPRDFEDMESGVVILVIRIRRSSWTELWF